MEIYHTRMQALHHQWAKEVKKFLRLQKSNCLLIGDIINDLEQDGTETETGAILLHQLAAVQKSQQAMAKTMESYQAEQQALRPEESLIRV